MARVHGFAGLELRALRGRVDLPAALLEEFGSPEVFARTVKEAGLRVPSLDSSLRLHDAGDAQRIELEVLAEWADAAGIPYLRVFDGGETGAGSRPEVRTKILREWNAWQHLRERRGFACDVMVETHWALVDPKAALQLGEESGGRLRLLWDIGHTSIHSGLSLTDTWALLRELVCHIHLKDLAPDAATPRGWRDVLPGTGKLAVPALLDELSREGFAGAVSLEWEKFWHRDLPPLEEALLSGRRHGWW